MARLIVPRSHAPFGPAGGPRLHKPVREEPPHNPPPSPPGHPREHPNRQMQPPSPVAHEPLAPMKRYQIAANIVHGDNARKARAERADQSNADQPIP